MGDETDVRVVSEEESTERRRDRGRHAFRVADGRERHQDRSIGELAPRRRCKRQPEPRLADVAGAAQGQESDVRAAQQGQGGVQLALPPEQRPTNPQTGSSSVVQFFLLDDAKTGVLALGSFSGDSFANLQNNLLAGLQNLKDKGATQLIVDVSNNGGGYICLAHVRPPLLSRLSFPHPKMW